MRIISKFSDYYDSLQNPKDNNLIFKRIDTQENLTLTDINISRLTIYINKKSNTEKFPCSFKIPQ